ncbi:membrane protein insertase YidC [Sphingomonas sp. CCH15-F11]|uniref:membrane protein insertase YidC n=1 Tax=Sphingomonas sp. CCH15-F11 TaxID=1768785 RepID=UPI000834342A|nr:membrane protein insertase YidC [Sphingomonas sp. CCH15-F11]
MKDEQKNFLLFAVLAAVILFAWEPILGTFFPNLVSRPPATVRKGEIKAAPAPDADPTADSPAAIRDRAIVLRETPRIAIETPRLRGSINLKGARIDDLVLVRHSETIERGSPPIRLLSPSGARDAYFAAFGWSGSGVAPPAPDALWQASGARLTPATPVTLSTTSGGQQYQIRIAIDDGYLFTVQQSVRNAGAAPVSLTPYALLSRQGVSKDRDTWTIHAGPLAVHNGAVDYGVDYSTVGEDGPRRYNSTGGWIGFTDIYWLTALVPDQKQPTEMQFRSPRADAYQADFRAPARVIAPGQSVTQTTRFFAGAKEVELLDRYEDEGGITLFGNAIDWGWFEIIEKPIFTYLTWLFRMVGNFGVAIILLTCTVRLLMFPIAQRQFASMASMRAIQPKLKALQERWKDDKPRLQQEMMKLYKDEKVNPVAGCLPTLLQIPVFYALYKVLMLTIEMRHQPFVLWIKDLSAPDPLTPVNLFGLIPFTPPAFLAIGVIPILLGVSMYFQFKLNPAPMDETQKQVFAIMPWVLMFVMAPFAVGLQVYWITSNVLTIAQQQWLYSRHPALKQKPAT